MLTVKSKKVRTQAEELILTDQTEMDNADAALLSISELAYSTKVTPPKSKEARSERSRFFFTPSESLDEEIKRRKKQFKKPIISHVDTPIQKRVKKYKKQVPKVLKANITVVREFFLKEIAPRTLAMDAGSTQARAVVQEMLKTEVDVTMFNRFERMVNSAANISMATFIAAYFGLPKQAANQLLAELNFKPQFMSMPPIPQLQPMPAPRNRRHSTTPMMSKPRRRKEREEEFEF
jgi:hypothetical protein